MNDRCLFRGKRIDNGKWVNGKYFAVNLTASTEEKHFILPKGSKVFKGFEDGYLDIQAVEVEPATVCQYTGLHDENGVKIFEGAVVRSAATNYIIKFNPLNGFIKIPVGHDGKYYSGLHDHKGYEVIGNIHDKENQ